MHAIFLVLGMPVLAILPGPYDKRNGLPQILRPCSANGLTATLVFGLVLGLPALHMVAWRSSTELFLICHRRLSASHRCLCRRISTTIRILSSRALVQRVHPDFRLRYCDRPLLSPDL